MGDMSPERVRFIVVGMIIFILSVAVHEFGHAFVADKLGDRLPRAQGRVTMNPMAHADPIGTLLLPFFFLATTGSIGFAWGKPVMHTTHDRKRRLFISAAGPAMNVVLATVTAAITIALMRFNVVSDANVDLLSALHLVVLLNYTMFFFNLLPAAPLDGGSVVRGLIPESWVDAWDRYAVYAPFVLLAFLMIPKIGVIVWRPSIEATRWVLDLFARLFGMA
jgi:Zn-dependent protease